jgi:hypothetical protein
MKPKAEAACSAPTSITGKSLKALFAFGDFLVRLGDPTPQKY